MVNFLSEKSDVSQRKMWSFSALIVFWIYVLADLYAQYKYRVSINMPDAIKWIIMAIVTYYFGKRAVDYFKNKGKTNDVKAN